MIVKKRLFYLFLAAMILPALSMGCKKSAETQFRELVTFASYKDIPGVTDKDIAAIDALRETYDGFIFGVMPSNVGFYDENGDIRGFFAMLCEWLTGMFGIPFTPKLYCWENTGQYWTDLADYNTDFTGHLTATEERRKTYRMTSAISHHAIRIFRLAGSMSLDRISQERKLRYVFTENTSTINYVLPHLEEGTYEIVIAQDTAEIFRLLESGEADAFFNDDWLEASFDAYGNVVSSDFFPLIFSTNSLATQNPGLEPVIAIVQKALDNGALRYLTALYNQGQKEYLGFKLRNQLTEEEREYIKNNPIVPVGAIYSNYPISFYNNREKEWQGIFFDLLAEIEILTGLSFTLINDEYTEWLAIQQMLENRDVAFVSDLIWTKAREEHFIWSDISLHNDHYALISRVDYPNVTTNEILHAKVGLTRDTAYTAMFLQWFPGHENIVVYDGIGETFNAMRDGEVDMVMTTERRLMFLTHYQELTGYKVNYVFNQGMNTKFGFNKSEAVLCSIINKALNAIDTAGIANQWMRKTFDYRAKVAEAQRPLLIVLIILSALLLCTLSIVVVFLVKNRRFSKNLETIVEEQTRDLAESYKYARKAQEEAEMANQTKSSFLAHMSHEIRTPMNSIVGFSELALGDAISPKTRDYLANILENAQWLLHIINDILDISKIESGKLELERVPFSLPDIFTACRTMIMPKTEEKGLLLHFYAEPSVGKIPLGDPVRLRQVIANLLSNAEKFTNSGIIKVQAIIKYIDEKTVTVHFEVKDSGIGMTSEQIERIFNPFIQAESGTTRKYGGTGLGLTITNYLVKMMGGQLMVESTPGVGSKFSFELTFDTIDADAGDLSESRILFAAKFPAQSDLDKPAFKGEVLLCEDNAMNQQVMCEHLARVGLKTILAENGKIGVDMVQSRMQKGEKQFDLIFMDMHMPVMDGLEAAAKIMELNTGIPIVALTANIMSHDRELYKMSGMVDYVGKPFTSQELWRCLMKFFTPVSWKTENKSQHAQAENDLRQKLIHKFVHNNRNKYNEIKNTINAGDIKLAHRLAHTLKSNAGQLGKTLLQQAAEDVEYQLKDGKNDVSAGQMAALAKELDAVIAELEPLVQNEAPLASAKEPLDIAAAKLLLEKLKPLLEKSDPECQLLIGDIQLIPGSEALIEKMDMFDFTSALETLNDLMKKL